MLDNYLNIINDTPLFVDVTRNEVKDLLQCMNAHTQDYPKGDFIFLEGDKPNGIGILLEGEASIINEDVFGNRTILGKVMPGDIFGEVFACAGIEELPISVEAEKNCKVLIMDYKKIITTCSSSCKFHSMLIKNMLRILAEKNLYLNNKNSILSSRTIRDKLLKYFDTVAQKNNCPYFDIPYDRQELADFLGINRSAMTRELIKMKEDGLIDFSKNHFKLMN